MKLWMCEQHRDALRNYSQWVIEWTYPSIPLTTDIILLS